MTKHKTTKRALLGSVMALLLCCVMLIGTTFAWFTSEVASKENIIQSGTLKATLEYADGTKATTTSDWKDASETAIFGYDKWEPGYVDVKHVKIENEGNLAFKYQLTMEISGTDEGLAKVIDVYYADPGKQIATRSDVSSMKHLGTLEEVLAGISNPITGNLEATDSSIVTIALKMQEDAGNEYQGLESNAITLKLLAVQDTVESDSFDNQYDKDATKEVVAEGLLKDTETGEYIATSTEGLSSVSALATADSAITSVTYVTNGGEVEVPVVRDTAAMNTQLSEGESTIVLTEGTYTVGEAAGKTVTLVGNENTKVDVTSGLTYVRGANVTFEGLTIQSAPEGAGYTNGLADAAGAVFNNCVIDGTLGLDFSCEFNNCKFNISGDYYNLWTWGAGTATFNGCTFNCDGKALLVYANVLDNGTSHQTVNINNCVFNDNGDDTITGKAAIEITDTYPENNITYDVIINNTTVNGFSVTTQNATTFGGTDLGTNVWGNKNLLTTDDLNVVIDGVDVH